MLNEVMYAGFGGQGLVMGATVLANIAASAGMHATIVPSYGNEQRGGAAFCDCKFCSADEEIWDPRADHPTVLIAMNEFAYDRYGKDVAEGGLILSNQDSDERTLEEETRCRVYKIPCTTMADKCGDARAANFVMLGAAVKLGEYFTEEFCEEQIAKYFESHGKGRFAEINVKAFKAGYACV